MIVFEEELVTQWQDVIPERPSDSSAYTEDRMAEDFPGSLVEIKNMIAKMKEFRGRNSKIKTTGHWSLDARIYFDWKTLGKKNTDRDYRKYAAAAYLEEHFVNQYRKDLLKGCEVAAFLRSELHKTLSQFTKERLVFLPEENNSHPICDYYFPDHLSFKAQAPHPEFNIEDVLTNSSKNFYIKKANSSIASVCKQIKNNLYARRIPHGTDIDPEISSLCRQLERVRCFLILILLF